MLQITDGVQQKIKENYYILIYYLTKFFNFFYTYDYNYFKYNGVKLGNEKK